VAVGDVADVVQGLDLPVPADPSGELGGGSLAEGQAGDRIDGDGLPFPAGQRPGPPGDADDLRGVREGQPGGDGDGLQDALFLAAVAAVATAGGGVDGLLRQFAQMGVQDGLIPLTTKM
jgi:hypothetical protein